MAVQNIKFFEKDKYEYGIFLFVIAIGTVLGTFSIAIDFIVPSPQNSMLDTFGFIYFGAIFIITKIKRVYKPFIYPTLIILFLISPAYWIESGGLSIIGVLVYIAAIVMCIFIAPLNVRRYVMFSFLAVTLLYPTIDLVRNWSQPDFEHSIASTYLYFVFISIGIQYATAFIKNNFDSERMNIKKFGQSLEELHRLNMTEWPGLKETFVDYIKTGCKLLGANKAMITKKEWNKWRVLEVAGFKWSHDLEEFNKYYKTELGEIDTGTTISGNDKLIFDEKVGSIMVVPILIEGSFYGHFVYGWQEAKEVQDYELEFAELMAQNLGYFIARENRSEEEKVTKEALNMSELRFRRVFENTIAGIAVADLNGNFIMVNPAFRKMLGYSEDELLQMNFSQTGHPEDLDEDIIQFGRLIKGEIDGYQIEKRNVRKDGTILNISLTVSLIKDTKGTPIYGIGIIEDISQRKKSEQEIHDLNKELEISIQRLEGTNRELESFSYSVSHDLRAPLRAINGFSKILVDEYSKSIDDEGKRLIDVVAANAKKMSLLIDDLLRFSKLNRQSQKIETVDLNLVIGEIIQDVQLQYTTEGIIKIPEPLPSVKADKALLRQALINIISNALKFSSKMEKSEVVIRAKKSGRKTSIVIEDNGVGFEMKYHDKLFQVFQRLHSDREFKGTGVGLAIVERIINRHGGKVWAESKPGEGAKFTLELPN